MPVSILADPYTILYETQNNNNGNYPYTEAILSLMYFMAVKKPDTTYVVNMLRRFIEKFNMCHV